jgi:phosphatidylinositol alpha 1,6-mannosyltransferase
MKPSDLRVALFSGNYNYVRDGANQALNLLVGYLLAQGVKVRVYSPTTETPAFPPTGDLVSVPSWPVPGGRDEYKFAKGIKAVLPDLEAFAPNVVHISAPEILCHQAVAWAHKNNIASVASVHTRFETYPLLIKLLTRLYNRVDTLLMTGRGMEELLRSWGVTKPMRPWSRGVNHDRFNPGRRSLEWRRGLGIQDDEVAVAFLGRLVLEKGLDIFAEVVAELERRGVKHRVLVIGKGPAQEWFAERVPDAVFAGFQAGDDLGRAVASMDVFFNPSLTESFGNVTLEAMAAGVPVVAANAVGPVGMVEENVSGVLVEPGKGAVGRYADAIQHYCEDHEARKAAGAAGHQLASAYVWDVINQKVIDAYIETIERRAG